MVAALILAATVILQAGEPIKAPRVVADGTYDVAMDGAETYWIGFIPFSPRIVQATLEDYAGNRGYAVWTPAPTPTPREPAHALSENVWVTHDDFGLRWSAGSGTLEATHASKIGHDGFLFGPRYQQGDCAEGICRVTFDQVEPGEYVLVYKWWEGGKPSWDRVVLSLGVSAFFFVSTPTPTRAPGPVQPSR